AGRGRCRDPGGPDRRRGAGAALSADRRGSRVISWPVARAAAREKLRSPAILVVGACFVAAGALGGRAGAVGDTFGRFGIALLLVLTLALGAGLLSDELDSGHAQLVLLR